MRRAIIVAGALGVVGAVLWKGAETVKIDDTEISLDDIIVNGVKRNVFAPILSGVAAVTGAKLSRGLRNNNPGNIRKTTERWQGAIGDDGEYVVFDTMENGIRALCRVLDNYRRRYGFVTVQSIISRWAPPNENNTGAYINAVADALGVMPGEVIDTSDPAIMRPLIHAIVKHENGYDPLTEDQINTGIFLARNVN